MPRLTQQAVTRPAALVEKLAAVHGRIRLRRRDNLGDAKEAGDLLLTVPPRERAALAAEAGIDGRSTRFVYVQISENWESVQHAGSIREALKILSNTRRPGRERLLPFEERCVIRRHDVTGRCVDDR